MLYNADVLSAAGLIFYASRGILLYDLSSERIKLRSQQSNQPPSSDVSSGSGAAGSSGNKPPSPPQNEEGKKWVGFDPTGLERAAKAARELDASGMG